MGKDPACHSQAFCGQHPDNIDQYLIVFIKTAPGSIPAASTNLLFLFIRNYISQTPGANWGKYQGSACSGICQ